MEQMFLIYLFRSETLANTDFFACFELVEQMEQMSIYFSYINKKIYKICVYKQMSILSVPSVPKA